jgi:hypothetical protein
LHFSESQTYEIFLVSLELGTLPCLFAALEMVETYLGVLKKLLLSSAPQSIKVLPITALNV